MTDSYHRSSLGLVLLAAIGAGALSGGLMGLLLTRRPPALNGAEITETVEDLKRRAENILDELSQSAASPTKSHTFDDRQKEYLS